jgi:undecaprenyl diphosphate synthase
MGVKDNIPAELRTAIDVAQEETKAYESHIFNLALDYEGYDELLRAIKKMAANNYDFKNVKAEDINKNLDNGDQPYPNPEVIIRTGVGNQRLSAFMMVSASYSEYVFPNMYFPDLVDDAKRKKCFDDTWAYLAGHKKFVNGK